MSIKNTLARAAGIAVAAVAIAGLGMTGVASASTAKPAASAAIHSDATSVGSGEKFHITCTG